MYEMADLLRKWSGNAPCPFTFSPNSRTLIGKAFSTALVFRKVPAARRINTGPFDAIKTGLQKSASPHKVVRRKSSSGASLTYNLGCFKSRAPNSQILMATKAKLAQNAN